MDTIPFPRTHDRPCANHPIFSHYAGLHSLTQLGLVQSQNIKAAIKPLKRRSSFPCPTRHPELPLCCAAAAEVVAAAVLVAAVLVEEALALALAALLVAACAPAVVRLVVDAALAALAALELATDAADVDVAAPALE